MTHLLRELTFYREGGTLGKQPTLNGVEKVGNCQAGQCGQRGSAHNSEEGRNIYSNIRSQTVKFETEV